MYSNVFLTLTSIVYIFMLGCCVALLEYVVVGLPAYM